MDVRGRGRALGLSEPSVTGERPCRDFGAWMRLVRGDPTGDGALFGVVLFVVALVGVALDAEGVTRGDAGGGFDGARVLLFTGVFNFEDTLGEA